MMYRQYRTQSETKPGLFSDVDHKLWPMYRNRMKFSSMKKFYKRITYERNTVNKAPGSAAALNAEVKWYTSKVLEPSVKAFMAPFIGWDEPSKIIVLRNVHFHIPLKVLASADVKLGTRSYDSSCSIIPQEKYWNQMLSYGKTWSRSTDNRSLCKDATAEASYPSKRDYMAWRDESTTTKKFGFRVTYLKHPVNDSGSPERHDDLCVSIFGNDPSCDYTEDAVVQNFIRFFFFHRPGSADISSCLNNSYNVFESISNRIRSLGDALRASNTFNSVNVIGSSLYFGFKCGASTFSEDDVFLRWIDFSHVEGVPSHEKDDGILQGIDNLLAHFELVKKACQKQGLVKL